MIQSALSKTIRASGQALDSFGRIFETNSVIEKLQPSTQFIKYGKNVPVCKNLSFVSPSATVFGKVTMGSNSSVWYGAVVRGDVNTITIGENTTIGDRVMVHASSGVNFAADKGVATSTTIGSNVVIGSGAIIHGCIVEDGCMIGEGAQVLDGARVSKNSIVAAGSLVTAGKIIPPNQYWGGMPAKYMRNVLPAETQQISEVITENIKQATLHASECAKSWQTIELEEYDYEQKVGRNDSYYKRLTPEELSQRSAEVEGHMVPGRIFDSPISSSNSQQKDK